MRLRGWFEATCVVLVLMGGVMPPPRVAEAQGPVAAGGAVAGTSGGCTTLRGKVMNWGYRDEPGITVELRGGDYTLQAPTTGAGLFEFQSLGNGYVLLSPVVAPGQGLKIYTDQVMVPLRCEEGRNNIVANLGLYSGDARPVPPVDLTLTSSRPVSGTVSPGEVVDLQLTVRNGLPTGISGALVTELFPSRLKPVSVAATRGEPALIDDRMVALWIGQMSAGEEISATVSAVVDPKARVGETLANRATLLYAESMADQELASLTVGPGEAEVAEAMPAPAAERAEAPTLLTVSAALVVTATDGPPALLPVTGGEAAVMPVAGFALAILVIASRRLKKHA